MEQMQDKYRDHYTMHGIIADEIPEKPVVREPAFVQSDAATQLFVYAQKMRNITHNSIVIDGHTYWPPSMLD